MAKLVYISVILIAIGITYFSTSSDQKFIIPEDDFWWGPGKPTKENTAIRPFTIQVPDQVLEDLKWRLDHTRLQVPPLEGIDFQYGFNSDTLTKLIEFWRLEYKWRERESYLNKLPQFKTQIQGLDIHFIHIKPQIRGDIKRTVPLLLLHGWPGSVREFYELVPLLTEKPLLPETDFVFELVIPSLPGYVFSQAAARPGLGNAECAVVFKNLMKRLGYQKYYVQGGDWGSQVASHMGLFFPDHVLGLHLNLCADLSVKTMAKVALGSLVPWLVLDMKDYPRMYPYSEHFTRKILESGYLHLQATKPDTVGIGLQDSPAGLAAYILEKFSTGTNLTYRHIKDGGLTEKYTYTDLLDNVMLYWITGSITSSMRLYAENYSMQQSALGLTGASVGVPVWCSKYRHEILWYPDWMLRSRYPNLVRSMQHDFGGHFAALENPNSLADDIWRAFVEGDQILKLKR